MHLFKHVYIYYVKSVGGLQNSDPDWQQGRVPWSETARRIYLYYRLDEKLGIGLQGILKVIIDICHLDT